MILKFMFCNFLAINITKEVGGLIVSVQDFRLGHLDLNSDQGHCITFFNLARHFYSHSAFVHRLIVEPF